MIRRNHSAYLGLHTCFCSPVGHVNFEPDTLTNLLQSARESEACGTNKGNAHIGHINTELEFHINTE